MKLPVKSQPAQYLVLLNYYAVATILFVVSNCYSWFCYIKKSRRAFPASYLVAIVSLVFVTLTRFSVPGWIIFLGGPYISLKETEDMSLTTSYKPSKNTLLQFAPALSKHEHKCPRDLNT